MTCLPTFARAALSACLAAAAALPASAGTWGAPRTLEGPFAVSSPPDAPHVVMNGSGHALLAWNATGVVRYADKQAGGAWTKAALRGASDGAGPVAVALGNNEVAVIAWTTVATRYVPSQLMAAVRPRGAGFGAAAVVAPGTGVHELRAGVACDGAVTLVWSAAAGVFASGLAGVPGAQACDGAPAAGPWTPPVPISSPGVGAALPDLAVNDAGAALAVWQQGVQGQPNGIFAALRPAGGAWEPAAQVSAATGQATWNAKPGLDVAGGAAVGYLDGNTMVVARRPAAGVWTAPVAVSGTQAVYYPALAMSAQGDMLAAWQTLDPATGAGAVWQASAPAGAPWAAPARLSAPSESAGWPSAAFAGDGSVAVVGWVDDASNGARAAVSTAGAWTRTRLGAGWWGGTVPVAAGSGAAVAGWAVPAAGNPNSAKLMARGWQ